MVNRLPPFFGVVKVDSQLLVGVVFVVASQLFGVDVCADVCAVVASASLASAAEAVPEGPLSRRRDNGASLPLRSSKSPRSIVQNQTR